LYFYDLPMPENVMPNWINSSLFCLALAIASTLSAGALADIITLNGGAEVKGTVVKRNDRAIWIDVGPEILMFKVEDVGNVDLSESEGVMKVKSDSLFRTAADLPELSPREQAKRIGPAVIKVSTPGGLGSGVIINDKGNAITNAHVIQGETNLRATVWITQPDGTLKRVVMEDIEIIAVNNHLDLALLRIPELDSKGTAFAPLELAESVEIGQPVFAIGNPLGLERTMSQGVISTTQRSFDGITYIQTDAAINPGNSGGPLFNTKGEVVGITNMGILGGEALGFAIPTRYLKDFIRNREAFSYDKDNPNSGHRYHPPPSREAFGPSPGLDDSTSVAE
jgi:serine protease Do